MKREEIIAKWDGMTARERDAWVAEDVLDITVYPRYDRRPSDEVYDNHTGDLLPRYTEDISAAWSVFERYPYVEVARIPGESTSYGVRVNGLDGSVRAMTRAATAPEAICLAALIAKLTEVNV